MELKDVTKSKPNSKTLKSVYQGPELVRNKKKMEVCRTSVYSLGIGVPLKKSKHFIKELNDNFFKCKIKIFLKKCKHES